MLQTLLHSSRRKSICACAGLLLAFLPKAVAQHVDGDAQVHVDGTTQSLNDMETFTGDGYSLSLGDVGYESSSQVNAIVLNGGGELDLVSGADIAVQNDENLTAFLRVGYGSGAVDDGTLGIADGATLLVGGTTRYANFQIGQGSGVTGTVNQTGGNATIIGSMNIGVNGGTGVYNLSGGTLEFSNAGTVGSTLISVGFNNSTTASGTSSGMLNITGGVLQLDAPVDGNGSVNFIIGNRASSALEAYSGNATNVGNEGAGDGVVTQTGGVFSVGAGASLFLSGYNGNGTYNLEGGTLEVGGTGLQAEYGSGNPGAYAFNFGGASGATIQVVGSDLTTAVNVTLNASNAVSIVDTNGFNATFSGNFTAPGLQQNGSGGNGFVKTGLGTLTLTGANNVFDSAFVTGGELDVTSGATSAVELAVGTGVTGGVANTGNFTMSGGTLTINPSTASDGTTVVSGSFRVGDFGGTGVFTQTGGTVDVTANSALNIGNQGGNGIYNLEDGTLILNQGTHVLGRSVSGYAAGSGTLSISGGTLLLQDGAELINGNNLSGGAAGTGTITQTGGVISVEGNSALYISGYSSAGLGTYNLNGGTLEVGGNGLQARYNNSTSDYAFNFGGASGATIQVVGSDLTTVVDVTLNASNAVSIVDTNGFNATFSGNFTAPGIQQNGSGGNGFVKTGAGTLTLTGVNNVFDSAFVMGGELDVTSGATSAVELAVGTGVGNTGNFTLSGGTLTINSSENANNTAVVAGAFRVGDFGGTGVFNQTGGTLTINGGSFNIGNQGGNGTYNLSGGTINLADGGLSTLGRTSGNTTSYGGSTGLMTVSGAGVLNISGGSDFVLSNWYPSSGITQGNGTLTQTGGVIAVDGSSALTLTGNGYGIYNLDGGTLQIGGDSLVAVFGGESGVYEFNLGGGTVQVAGSDLSTTAVPTLVAGTTSTIDTTNYNATFSNGFAGTGGFDKIGVNNLTLNGATVLSGNSTSVGYLTVGGGSSATGSLTVASGTTLTVAASATTASWMLVGNDNGNGTVTNEGTIAVSTASANHGALIVGYGWNGYDGYLDTANGKGTLNTSGNITVTGVSASDYATFYAGYGQDANGTVNQTGGTVSLGYAAWGAGVFGGTGVYNMTGGAVFNAGTGVTGYLGCDGSGTLHVSDSAQFLFGTSETPAAELFLGQNSGDVGQIIQDGANSVVSIVTSSPLYFGQNGSGTYTLSAGSLTLSAGGIDFGSASGGTGTFTQSGGTSQFIGNVILGASAGDGSGSGIFNLSGGTAILDNALVIAAASGSTGAVSLTGGTLEVGGANGIQAGSGAYEFNLGGGTVQVTGSDLTTAVNATLVANTTSTINTNGLNATWSGSLAGTGGLTKTGAGTFQFTGTSSSYSGAATVQQGTFEVDGVLSGAAITVDSGATFAGHGTVGSLNILDGGYLTPGGTPGLLTVTGDVDLAATSLTLLQVTDATHYDHFLVGGVFNAAGTLQVGFLNDFSATQGTDFDLINGTISGTFAVLDLPTLSGGLQWDTSELYTSGTISVVATAIPEPATWGAIFGVVALLAAFGYRRLRR